MDLSRAVYSRDLKIAAMRALDAGSATGEIARKYQLSPKLLERWRGEWRAKGESAFPGVGRRGHDLPAVDDARRIAELERKIGQLTMENDFLKKALQHFRDHHPPAVVSGADVCLKKSQASGKGQAVSALCQMTGLSRAGFYRWRVPRQATPVEMELRDQLQKIALESPAYGYRRITAELQQRGFAVNHKRVLRMMREDNLLCVRGRAFVATTDSRHNLRVYPNLAREMNPTAINELWIADITYIRLRTEFVFLAVVLDAYSRRVIGWALGRTLEAALAVSALRMALIERQPAPGLVHHSDRGVQYASYDYTETLKQHSVTISMSRKGNPYDNAACESFMKTLKYEEVYRNEYRDFHEARAGIGEFLERVYNQKRLHSALGYVPPAEFEDGATT
ncbi:MAG: IS3 family transposase [Xanthobacteraceae bacterium]